jgi:hypothetical protein
MKKGKEETLAPTVKNPQAQGKKKQEVHLTAYQKFWLNSCVPSGTEGWDQAEHALDAILTIAIDILTDKEISKKSVPYAKAYTMKMLDTTFDFKSVQHDFRNDDIYLQDPQDSEEPLLPANDNVAHKLGYNNENLILKFYRPNIETVSMFKIDEESRSRLSLSKHDKMSSKGHKRPKKNESA